MSDCFWFIEATNNENTILLSNSESSASFQASVPAAQRILNTTIYSITEQYNSVQGSSTSTTTNKPNRSDYVDYYSKPAMLPSPDYLPSIIVSFIYLN